VTPIGPLACQRDLFEIPEGVSFLNCANLSPQLRAVTTAGLAAVRRKIEPWTTRSGDWFSTPEALRTTAAELFGTESDGVALVPAASYGIAIAAANVPMRSGQNVVLLSEQFPSNVYAWRERAAESGATIRTVQKDTMDDWTDAVIDAIDEDTAVVAVPNCHWTDGALLDLVRVGERTRAVGAALVVDASQSFGAYPLSVDDVKPDFLVSVGYKWQLGPYGLGYLYVAPRWRDEGRPLEQSWLTRAGAEDFAGLVDYVDDYRHGARRFDMGGYPQFVLAPMALAALSQIREWRVDRIQVTLRRWTDELAQRVKAPGLTLLEADRRVGHILGIRFPAGIPSALSERLAADSVVVSIRGGTIRVAPHLYNRDADADRLLSVLREFA